MGLTSVSPYSMFNVERASSKWVFGPDGRLHEVGPDELAYDYDPATGQALGVLIEETRTNLLTWSEDFTQADWNKRNSSIETGDSSSPAGGAAQAVIDGAEVAQLRQTKFNIAAGIYTFTLFFKKKDHDFGWIRIHDVYFNPPQLYFNLDTLEISYISHSGLTNTALTRLSDGWIKLTVNVEVGLGDEVRIYAGGSNSGAFDSWLSDGDGVSGTYIWGTQLEEGSSPSSYIPTQAAPVTRAADRVSRELGIEFNQNEGTFVVDLTRIEPGTGTTELLRLNGADGNYMWLRGLGTNLVNAIDLYCRKDGIIVADTGGPSIADGYTGKLAFTYSGTDGYVFYADGSEVSTIRGSALVPDVTTMVVRGFVQSACAIYYIPRALTPSKLAELTS